MTLRQALGSLATYAAASLIWNWRLIQEPLSVLQARQVDAYGHAWHAMQPLAWRSASSGFPEGELLSRADAFVFWLLAQAVPNGLGPLALSSAMLLLGPVVSAIAADYCALRWGARWPLSLVAGLAWGFGAGPAHAMLEGHSYSLLDPWTPLLLATLPSMRGPGSPWISAVTATGAWAGALLTSAYSGIVASILLAFMLGVSTARGEFGVRRVAPVLAGVLVVGTAYVLLFFADGPSVRTGLGDHVFTQAAMTTGSADLASLLAYTPGADVARSSMTAVLPWTATVVAFWFASGAYTPRRLVVLGVLGVLLSLGPNIRVGGESGGWPGLLWPLAQLEVASFFRFPVRLLPLANLSFGVAAAVGLSSMRGGVWFVPAALVDALVLTGVPFRTVTTPFVFPAAYASLPDGAVLELLPDASGVAPQFDLFITWRACAAATIHGRPLLARCLSTSQGDDNQHALSNWLFGALARDLPVAPELARRGVGSVVVHPLLFTTDDGPILARLPNHLGPAMASSTDAGDPISVYGVVGAVLDRQAAMVAWQEPLP